MVSGPAATPEWADYAKQLGINLRRARDAKGYTQEKMAERNAERNGEKVEK